MDSLVTNHSQPHLPKERINMLISLDAKSTRQANTNPWPSKGSPWGYNQGERPWRDPVPHRQAPVEAPVVTPEIDWEDNYENKPK